MGRQESPAGIRYGDGDLSGSHVMTDQALSVFNEFRTDGWPLCPVCEEDELWCPGSTMFFNEQRRPPTVAECIQMGLVCYRCQNSFAEGKITSIKPWEEVEPGLFKVAVDPHLRITIHGMWLALLKIPHSARKIYRSFALVEERTELGQRYFTIRGSR